MTFLSACFFSKSNPLFRTDMAGLSDSLTIGILLTLIFGAVSFYLYSRMTQNEKRLSLLENLLLTLKIATEASLMGPESVETVSNQTLPLNPEDIDTVEEEQYADMLKEVASASAAASSASAAASQKEQPDITTTSEEEAEELLRSMNVEPSFVNDTSAKKTKVDANYESFSLKELQSLAKERGLTGVPSRKKDLIEALKKQGGGVPVAPTPLPEDGLFHVEL